MKHFLIKYTFTTGSEEEWHKDVARFIAALESDPVLKGKIAYRCMKNAGGTDYYHLASVEDDQAVKALQERDFFKTYTERTEVVGGGAVDVLPLSVIAQTALAV
jgi:hypothetical protein